MSSTVTSEINNILDPKLFQVIGSTPSSLKDSLLMCDIKGNKTIGMKYIALSIFAASVNKETLEKMFMQENMADLRTTISRVFVLNGKINMTAMSLSGHCFLTLNEMQNVKYAVEFRKKIGQNSIWDGPMAAGSISDKQRTILQEKSRMHSKESASGFANWFLDFTGTNFNANVSKQKSSSGVKGSKIPATEQSLASSSDDNITIEGNNKIPKDLYDFYIVDRLHTEEELKAEIDKNGIETTIRRIRKGRDSVRNDEGSSPTLA